MVLKKVAVLSVALGLTAHVGAVINAGSQVQVNGIIPCSLIQNLELCW